MSATSIHGVSIPLDSFGQASALGATDAEMEARASLREALRCAASGRIDRALAQARDVFGNDAASMELRLEAAKLCVDWHASLGAYEQCRKVAADAARHRAPPAGC